MKKQIILLFIASITFTTIFSGCAKDDTQITGNISYVAHSDSQEYIANGATVYLMVAGSTSDYQQKTTADNDGNYTFYPVLDGDYYIEADFTYLLDNYTGKTDKFSAKGKKNLTFDIIMH